MADEETSSENTRENGLMKKKKKLGQTVSRSVAVSQKNLSFSFPRLSTRIEVLQKTHLTFFISKEIIQLVTLRPQIEE